MIANTRYPLVIVSVIIAISSFFGAMGDIGFAIRLLVVVSFFSSNAHAWWDDSESNGQYPWLTKEPDVYVLEQLSVFLSGLLEGIVSIVYRAAVAPLLYSAMSIVLYAVLALVAYWLYRRTHLAGQAYSITFNNITGNNNHRELARLLRAPPEYNGTEDLNVWLAKMETYLKMTTCERKMWAAIAVSHINSSKLKNVCLEEIYGDNNGFERLKNELKRNSEARRTEKPISMRSVTARIQQRDENAQQYGNKLREMAMIALPGAPDTVIDNNMKWMPAIPSTLSA